MADSFAEWFNERLIAHGYTGAGGRERLSKLLDDQYGTKASIQAISHWTTGIRTPSRRCIFGLLDALDVHGAEREQVMRLAFGTPVRPKPDDIEADGPATSGGT
jgi:hypothetical protein